ncbi:isoprenoid biosynthesis glyoxalase ElbB [Arsenicibacter rosenii]|uniref:Isoprenoid biosynthesis protein ElbB n=1 Tax=Arsenicibacter rosenii TaxID=1750698 RepID=A0A1S2VQU2_9BACT|nr:isoprenoid biosynthesis glyoxalase ElbB [Arsenicibacter rosenii]OIN61157.1 isoprenoid biosynthesis protein ElbB [Arsenicibacter rosenii]
MKIGVLFHGSGVFDGTEIQEAVFTLLALAEVGAEAVCFAPDVNQHHVLNHLTGDEMPEVRNVLVESARIARGQIADLATISAHDLDGLVMPGGFGTAKNITNWAFAGPDGTILPSVKQLILDLVAQQKPIVGLCMSPTTIAKALEGSGIQSTLTVGTDAEASPYDINGIAGGMEKTGQVSAKKSVREIAVDPAARIITAPCYMMEASILDVRNNIRQAIDAMLAFIPVAA